MKPTPEQLEYIRKVHFVYHADEGCIIMALPSGWHICTPELTLYIDGGTHEMRRNAGHDWQNWVFMGRAMEKAGNAGKG